MNISNAISEMIFEMLEEKSEIEFKRNLLAQSVGCVPSQINYVLSSRFTPERGFIVESRRGGDGYVKITRISYTDNGLLQEVIGQTGESTDEAAARHYLINLIYHGIISEHDAALILAAISDSTLRVIPAEYRDRARAAIFKKLLAEAAE